MRSIAVVTVWFDVPLSVTVTVSVLLRDCPCCENKPKVMVSGDSCEKSGLRVRVTDFSLKPPR